MATRLVQVKNSVHNLPLIVCQRRTSALCGLKICLYQPPLSIGYIAVVHILDILPLIKNIII